MPQSTASRPTVILTPLRHGLRAGGENVVQVLVRIQAPDAPEGDGDARPPQSVALVLDRSGSMSGKPLEEAKRCADYVIGKLRPIDSLAIVSFDNRVKRHWPAVPVNSGIPQRAALADVEAGGSTNLHGGWNDGVLALSEVTGQGVKRVILLSDGQANQGLTDPAELADLCSRWASQGVTTSTYGLGDNFNEDLMVSMARAGGGNHYYGDTAEDLMEPSQQELELLGNLCLRETTLSTITADGIRVEMINELLEAGQGWRMSDLAWGSEAWALLRLTVPASAVPRAGTDALVLKVVINGVTLTGDAVQLGPISLILPSVPAASFDLLTEDELVVRRSMELAAADYLRQMRAAASAGHWDQVEAILARAREELRGNPWVSAMLDSMKALAAQKNQQRMMKEAMYSNRRLSTRLAPKNEQAFLEMGAELGEAPAFLRRKVTQGKGQA